MQSGRRTILTIAIAVCLGVALFFAIVHGGKKEMESSQVAEGGLFAPQEFKISDYNTSISLFPMPQSNSVGTNDMNNAITLISFPKGKVDLERHFRNAVNDIGGGGQYLPVISPDLVGLGQTRSFIIYDFKRKFHREYTITVSLAKTIRKIAIADVRSRHFIFQIEGQNSRSHDPWDLSNTLQLMNLSGEEAKLIKEISIGNTTIWTVVFDKNFLYDLKTKQLKIFDMNLEPTQHPLADIINQNKGKVGFTRIHAHPTLPFAILCAGKSDAMLVTWGQGRDKTPSSVMGEKATAALQFSFSPDGKWVTFKEGGAMNSNKTFIMPVSEKYPHYLGSPIQIWDYYFNDDNFAWTTNPTSFVGSSGEKIYRWDLENRDYPGKDKMSFHDYIVQQDLEKMAKEKKAEGGK